MRQELGEGKRRLDKKVLFIMYGEQSIFNLKSLMAIGLQSAKNIPEFTLVDQTKKALQK